LLYFGPGKSVKHRRGGPSFHLELGLPPPGTTIPKTGDCYNERLSSSWI